ncbi:hypothetical protein [Streptomyces sp. NPDC055140]
MQVDGIWNPCPDFTTESLLAMAEKAFLRAEFDVVRPLLQRLREEFGPPGTDPAAKRHDALLGALAARAGNWPEARRRCPEDLDEVGTGIVHALAVSALHELTREGRHTDSGTASVAIVLWAHLLDEEDPGDFRALLTERRGAPVSDALWEQALARLRGRVADLLHALDVRAERDALSAWHTAWAAERAARSVFLSHTPTDAGPHALVSLREAAWHLVQDGRGSGLLAAYTARHPDPGTWPAELPGHHACAEPLARALAARGMSRVRGGRWSEALVDIGAAVRLGHTLRADERAAVLHAGNNVGRSRTGGDNSPRVRIKGLEQAHALLPQDASLAAELAAELVRRGREFVASDPEESRSHFARALAVTPGNPDARAGLDDHLREDLSRALDGEYAGDALTADEVQGLLARDPDCAEARMWLEDHYADVAVSAATRGHTAEAQRAAHAILMCIDPEDTYDEADVDELLMDLLVTAADDLSPERNRADLERRVALLHTAVTLPSPTDHHAQGDLESALLDLAEYLDAAEPPSDVIELFLRDLMRTGVNGRFDQIVEAAYLNRARDRERAGDPGGARRDRASAERVGAGLPRQAPLFGSAARRSRLADTEQDTLF